MEEWKEYKLGDVINVLDNKRIPLSSKERSTRKGNFPYYGAQGIIDYINDFIFNGTYLLIAEDGENLKSQKQDIAQLATGKFWVNNHAHIVESNGLCDIRYLCYLINRMDLSGYITGSAQPKLNQANLLSIIIRLPLLRKQQYIANFISMFDDKIELNRRINENLEQQAQALFKSWFVDFEPFKDGKFVDSELGRIPEGWRVGVFNELVEILSGFAFKSNTFVEKGKYQLITIKAVQDGLLNISGSNYINIIPPKMPQYCFLRKGDILLSLTGNVGRTCIVTYDNLLLNQRVAKIKPKNIINRMFLYIILRQLDFKKRLIYLAKGTAQLNLSPIETGQIKIIIPSEEYLKKYADMMNSKFDMMLNNSIENIALSELRDTLLPRLMSGELAITDVDDRSIFQ